MFRSRLFGVIFCAAFMNVALSQDMDRQLKELQEHVASYDGYSDDTRQVAQAELDSKLEDDWSTSEIVNSVLGSISKDYATALTAYESGDTDNAITSLSGLKESDDAFLRTAARHLLVRCFLENEDHENAYSLLTSERDDPGSAPTLHQAETFFLKGICEAKLLMREEAMESFAEFMRTYPDAPERLRVTAWRQLETLALVEEGSLVDVYQKMEYSRRRLAKARTNGPTQTQQNATIDILDKLIEEAEEREAVSESESKKEGEGKEKSKSKSGGGGKEGLSGGGDDKTPMKTVRQVQQGTTRTPWDHLRDKKRDAKALAAIKDKYPARYRALIEQYYKSLQEESDK